MNPWCHLVFQVGDPIATDAVSRFGNVMGWQEPHCPSAVSLLLSIQSLTHNSPWLRVLWTRKPWVDNGSFIPGFYWVPWSINGLLLLPDSQSFMPFRLGELVPMTRVLCDACLGVVELAHPESKPTLTGNYRAAFQSVGASRDVLEPEELNASRELWAYLFKARESFQSITHICLKCEIHILLSCSMHRCWLIWSSSCIAEIVGIRSVPGVTGWPPSSIFMLTL